MIKKLKSRFCACGDTQIEGVDIFETYAPVVQWSTIRMLLTMAVQLNLKTRALDISNAFVTAPLGPDEQYYIEMPDIQRKVQYISSTSLSMVSATAQSIL
jgi:hypothetical protein